MGLYDQVVKLSLALFHRSSCSLPPVLYDLTFRSVYWDREKWLSCTHRFARSRLTVAIAFLTCLICLLLNRCSLWKCSASNYQHFITMHFWGINKLLMFATAWLCFLQSLLLYSLSPPHTFHAHTYSLPARSLLLSDRQCTADCSYEGGVGPGRF